MRAVIEARKRKLDDYFLRASAKGLDEQIQADLARHGAVLICGFVERCVEIVVLERLSYRAHPRVINFVKSHFKRGTNYDCEAIRGLLERLELDWANKFKLFMSDNSNLVSALESVYTLRNSIAHGGAASRGISGVIELYDGAQKIVDALITSTE